MFQILIAEDDAQLRQMFCRVLQRSGFTPIPVADGQEALEALEREVVDLIVSDIMMPRVDGYELVQALRESGSQIPVLMITAKDRFQDMQMGFLSGTDDFMVKPVNVNEMVLRINALLRRAKMITERRQTVGGTVLEFDGFTLQSREGTQVLPQKEFQLLYKLASYPGRIFTRQQLMEDIWGPDSESDIHTVDVHVGRLRERLRDNPDLEIVTVRGLGYKAVRKNG
ncbi:MAG: response regulator transcription factor [Clostridia bacterium]|nr:response regulator transcription factor [Clostridia bacterium]MBR6575146.1 response regulator transcription factor [Clostridia bacterium]